MKRFLCFLAALLLLTGPISAVSAAETGLFCAAGGDAAADLRLDLNMAEAGGAEPAALRSVVRADGVKPVASRSVVRADGEELAALRSASEDTESTVSVSKSGIELSGGPDPSSRMDWTDSMIDELLELRMRQEDAENLQQLIDFFARDAGSGEQWYVLILTQLYPGQYDYSAYRKALEEHVSTSRIPNPTTRELLALTLISVGSESDYIDAALEESAGEGGLMSLVFGLHLISNGAESEKRTGESVIGELLDAQKADGGWAVIGDNGDVDVTAMTLQALAEYSQSDGEIRSNDGGNSGGDFESGAESEMQSNGGESGEGYESGAGHEVQSDGSAGGDFESDAGREAQSDGSGAGGVYLPDDVLRRVHEAVDRALIFLEKKQLPGGGFSSMGTYNCESGAQVWLALSALGIDAWSDSRFTQMGEGTLPASLMDFYLGDAFAHTAGGEANDSANRQMLHALAAYKLRFGVFANDRSADDEGTDKDAEREIITQESQTNTGRNIYKLYNYRYSTPNAQHSGSDNANGIQSDQKSGIYSNDGSDDDSVFGSSDIDSGSGMSLRSILNIAVIAAACICCAVMFFLKKRNWKSYAIVGILAGALLLTVNLVDVELPSDYYGESAGFAQDAELVETRISIRCDTVAGEKEYIPADGTVLGETAVMVPEGASVYSQLVAACRTHAIQLESEGSSGVPYVSGIAYIYETDFGELSGWMFRVNGVFSAVGAGEAQLSEGDFVEWVYTRDLGHDVGDQYRPAG